MAKLRLHWQILLGTLLWCNCLWVTSNNDSIPETWWVDSAETATCRTARNVFSVNKQVSALLTTSTNLYTARPHAQCHTRRLTLAHWPGLICPADRRRARCSRTKSRTCRANGSWSKTAESTHRPRVVPRGTPRLMSRWWRLNSNNKVWHACDHV